MSIEIDSGSEADRLAVSDLLRHATVELRRAGVEDAGDEARRLLAAAAGLSAAQVLSGPQRHLTLSERQTFDRFLRRRCEREPLSRIVGEREFYGRPFVISPDTLDPRPDSETLIDAVLEIVRRDGLENAPLRILDVGTGSGCLLLTLLCELPNAVGTGSDTSAAALEIARCNASRLARADRACWRVADALDGIDGPFDFLVSNPPYIRSRDIAGLAPEVRAYDPLLALDGGHDGLGVYRRLAKRIPLVVPSGWVVLEVGHDQAASVAGIIASPPCSIESADIAYFRDVAGFRRSVAAKTRA